MRALSLLMLLPALALAQTGVIVQPATPPRGVTLPPTSAALVDEATALSVNPAGLRFVGPPQLFYLHERNLVRDQVGNGLYLGSNLGGLGAGFSLEWLRGRGLPDYRKTSFGLALGSRRLSLGASYHGFSSENAALDRLSGFDLGLTLRPTRFLSVGAVVRDVNAPQQGPFSLPRGYNLAVGLRPFGERLTLGADYTAAEGQWGDGRFSYTLQTTVLPGLGLGAGLSHGLGTERSLALQFAATLDSSRFGITYAGGGAEGGGLDHVVAVRLSSQKYPALRLGGGSVAMLDLDDELRAGGGTLALLGFSEPDPYLRLTRWMDEATKDPRLEGVVLKVSGLPGVDWGKAEELHQAVLRMRAAGKRVLAVLYSVDDLEYFVGSAADEVYALPSSALLINGLAAHVTSLGGTMEKL
ncbi:MAG TPA: signal peptide peptidase SppA, partial [Archangium sp.]